MVDQHEWRDFCLVSWQDANWKELLLRIHRQPSLFFPPILPSRRDADRRRASSPCGSRAMTRRIRFSDRIGGTNLYALQSRPSLAHSQKSLDDDLPRIPLVDDKGSQQPRYAGEGLYPAILFAWSN